MTRSGKPFDEAAYAASRGPALLTDLQDAYHQIRLLEAKVLDIVADLEREGIPKLTGHRPAGLISEALHLAPRHASTLVRHAALVAESLTPTGHTTPAALPTVREVVRDGVIDGEHIEVIAETLKALPDDAPLGAREMVESTLAEMARTHTPHAVREHGRELLAVLDPAGTRPDDEDKLAEPKNSFSYKLNHKGRMTFRGELEPESADLLQEMLHKYGGPDNNTDERSQRERHGDVVSNLVHAAARPEGTSSSTAVELSVFLDMGALTDLIGTATLKSACHLAPAAVRRLACDAALIPMVLNGHGVPLDVGQARRLVSQTQRDALIARDKGCAHPGCIAPARWTDAHHIKFWRDGGPTDLHNLMFR